VLDYCLSAGARFGSLQPGLDAFVGHGGRLHREHDLIR
jgi:hypothetical protein